MRTVGAREIREAINMSLGDAPPHWPPRARMLISGSELSVASAGLGPNGGIGGVVAGSWMATFPVETERLVFEVATNQATTVLQQARLLREHRRVAADLDERVAQRARELDAANQELQKEIAERRRTEHALRAGTRLRVTAELINAANGCQVWSERYDRELEMRDVFGDADTFRHVE